MASQHVATTFTFTSNGVTHSTTMYYANFATRGPSSYRRWYTCTICGFDYPEDQVVLKGDTAYCIPRGDDAETTEALQSRKRSRLMVRSRRGGN